MKDLLPFIITGIVSGAVYGLAGTGLVLTYRTSGIFNFAHGAIAAAAAYVFYWLNVVDGVTWWLSLVVAVGVLGPVAGLGLSWLANRLAPQPVSVKIVGTVGLILLVDGLADVKFGTDPVTQTTYFPSGSKLFRVGDVNISYSELIVTIVALVAVILLFVLLRGTRVGTAMRAVVDDPDLVRLHGTSARTIRAVAWILGTTFAALSGVLISPTLGVEAILLTYLVVQAFGAAAVGAFANIPVVFGAGLLIGIASAISTKYVANVSWLTGLPDALPFIVLFVVLLVLPQRKLIVPQPRERRPAPGWSSPPAARGVLALVVIAVLALVPTFASTNLTSYTVGLTQAIVILSLGLLVRTAGLVSLSQAAFAAIGAVSFAQLSSGLHLPWVLALIVGALITVPIAGLLAVPTIRLSGLFLALATFGFGLMLEQMFYPFSFMFTTQSVGRIMPRPSFAQGDTAFYFVVLLALILVAALVEAIQHMRLGRMLGGMAEAPTSLMTLGLSTTTVRVVVFCVAGFIAGVGGILYGVTVHAAASGDAPYASFQSLILLATLAIAPVRAPWYALVAVVSAVIPSYWHSGNAQPWLNALFGASAVAVSVWGSPSLPPGARRLIERLFAQGWLPRRGRLAPSVGVAPQVSRGRTMAEAGGLVVEHLTMRFGGNIAVDDLSLSVPLGRITGLIGPNGAGKTTTFNAASGLLRPADGRVHLKGRDVTRSSPARRGVAGLGRTFQVMQLCDSLTVKENVELGCEAGQAGVRVARQLVASPDEKRTAAARATQALELCQISGLAQAQAGSLSTGQRRLVDLARCLAGDFDVLLLDEPSSGLDPSETSAFADVLRQVLTARGVGMLIVEHDMSLMMSLCDHIYVLDSGNLIFEGGPEEVAVSPKVQLAYLGSASESTAVPEGQLE